MTAPRPQVGDRVKFVTRPEFGPSRVGEGKVERIENYGGGYYYSMFVVRDDAGKGHGVLVPPDGIEVVR